MATKKQKNKEAPKEPVAKRVLFPHVTEKATMLSSAAKPAYTFAISASLNKPEVIREVKKLYKVTPTKVRIVNLPGKSVFVRGHWGKKPGMKKALVYLKKGDKIEFV